MGCQCNRAQVVEELRNLISQFDDDKRSVPCPRHMAGAQARTDQQRDYREAFPKPPMVQEERITLDGRVAKLMVPNTDMDDPPYPLTPWSRPRYNSQELRAGILYSGCDCSRRNGLQDDCRRWDCSGRTACLTKPFPQCHPSEWATVYGTRKVNVPTPSEQMHARQDANLGVVHGDGFLPGWTCLPPYIIFTADNI